VTAARAADARIADAGGGKRGDRASVLRPPPGDAGGRTRMNSCTVSEPSRFASMMSKTRSRASTRTSDAEAGAGAAIASAEASARDASREVPTTRRRFSVINGRAAGRVSRSPLSMTVLAR
jgi:hypothetical protein